MTLSQLRNLVNILTDSLTQLEQACEKNKTSVPDLDEPFSPSSEAFRKDPVAAEAANIIGTAALHICDIVNPPTNSLLEAVGGPNKAAALRVCLESHVAEVLRDAGPQGLHVKDIAARNGQDPSKLGGCLRYLATYHIFKEITPDVFTHTRISSLLDTGKSVENLLAHSEQKHKDTSGLVALIAFQLDEGMKSATYLWEILSDPATVKSNEPSESAFTKYVGMGKTFWEYYADPAQSFRNGRFNIAMHGIQRLQPPEIMLSVYDWKSVQAGAVIVDVGGGVGTTQLCLARDFPQFKIIIQDRPNVIQDGIKMWNERNPDALRSGRVTFEAHDFFGPQPNRNVSFFFLKQILHDWPDKYCNKILTQLRKAATPNTKLLSMDSVIPYSCHDNSSYAFPGATPDEAPPPLKANYGAMNANGYRVDLTMLALFNAKERTVGDAVTLFEKSGWKIVEIHRQQGAQGAYLQCLEAVPIEVTN